MRIREASILKSNRVDPILVVLLNWNGWQDTIECLESLRHLEQPQDILVFDNGSENDSVYQLEEYLRSISIAQHEEAFELDGHVLHIVHYDVSGIVYRLCSLGENLGFSAGCNLAVKYAESMSYVYALLLNNDTVLESDSLRIMHEVFRMSRQISSFRKFVISIGPKLYGIVEERLVAGGVFVITFPEKWHLLGNKEAFPVGFATGCCMLFKVDFFRSIGGFTEQFFFGEEDVELSFRLRRRGSHVVCAASCYYLS